MTNGTKFHAVNDEPKIWRDEWLICYNHPVLIGKNAPQTRHILTAVRNLHLLMLRNRF